MSDWNAEKMYELGTRHARLEAERKLDELMDTLVPDPVYEYHPLGLRMSGGDRVRRYYAQFIDDFMQKVQGFVLLSEWSNAQSVCQEYDITLLVDGQFETHRTVGILYADPAGSGLLGGERIYGSERLVRLMAGPIFDELEHLED